MKKHGSLWIAAALIAAALLPGCAFDDPAQTPFREPTPAEEVTERTKQGTPIVDDFSDEIDMRSTPESDCFSAIGYRAGTLVVEFRDSGKRYAYYYVPYEVMEEFERADSLGAYYNRAIKGAYSCERLG